MDFPTAEKAIELYKAIRADQKFIENLSRTDWQQIAMGLKLEGCSKQDGRWAPEKVPLLNINTSNAYALDITKQILEYIISVHITAAQQRIAERNRKLAQLGFKREPSHD